MHADLLGKGCTCACGGWVVYTRSSGVVMNEGLDEAFEKKKLYKEKLRMADEADLDVRPFEERCRGYTVNCPL